MPTVASSSSILAAARLPAGPVQAGVEGEVLAAGQVAIEERLVAQVADPPPQLPGLARQIAAEDARASTARPQQRGEHAQQRRLAGAVGAEHDHGLAGGELGRDAVEGGAFAEVAAQALEGERGLVCGRSRRLHVRGL